MYRITLRRTASGSFHSPLQRSPPFRLQRLHGVSDSSTCGLLAAWSLQGKRSEALSTWREVNESISSKTPLWVHLDGRDEHARTWLQQLWSWESIQYVMDALLDEEASHVSHFDDVRHPTSGKLAYFISMRGMKLDPQSTHTDMVSHRMFLSNDLLITVKHQNILGGTGKDEEGLLRNALRDADQRPKSTVGCAAVLFSHLVEKILQIAKGAETELLHLDRAVHRARARGIVAPWQLTKIQHRLSVVRFQIANLQRFVLPQNDVLHELCEALESSSDFQEDASRCLSQVKAADLRHRAITDKLASLSAQALIAQESVSSVQLSALLTALQSLLLLFVGAAVAYFTTQPTTAELKQQVALLKEQLRSTPKVADAPGNIRQHVLQAAFDTAWQYSLNGVEGHRAGHILVVGSIDSLSQMGSVKGHNPWQGSDVYYIQRDDGSNEIMKYLNMDGATLVDGESGKIVASGFFAHRISTRYEQGGAGAGAAAALSMAPGTVSFKVSSDGGIKEFRSGSMFRKHCGSRMCLHF